MSLPEGSHEGIDTYVAHRSSQEKRPGGRGGAVPATFQGSNPPPKGGFDLFWPHLLHPPRVAYRRRRGAFCTPLLHPLRTSKTPGHATSAAPPGGAAIGTMPLPALRSAAIPCDLLRDGQHPPASHSTTKETPCTIRPPSHWRGTEHHAPLTEEIALLRVMRRPKT
jgi:hypothetical protein